MKNRYFIIIWFICWGTFDICAQDMAFHADSMFIAVGQKDKKFNAAEDKLQTFEGYDVDISRPGKINLGIQVAQDVVKMVASSKAMLDNIADNSFYKQRMDLMLSAALPERTNVYTILSFLATDNKTVNFAIVNMEIEHWFPGNHVKFRLGRLINKLSESQFFSRIALGETAAHVFGRSPFENDAFEIDINLKGKKMPVFFIGIKNRYKPVNVGGVYMGAHHRFKEKTQVYFLASATRQFEEELALAIPGYNNGKRWYYGYEMEVAHREDAYTVFANLGGYVNYIGALPHSYGKYDLLRLYSPIVEDKRDAMETFIPSIGFRLKPSKLSSALKFIPMLGGEAELLGGFSKQLKALNIYAYVKFNITNRLILTYSCNPQFIWNKQVKGELPSFLRGATNYFRLSLTIGKPARMMM